MQKSVVICLLVLASLGRAAIAPSQAELEAMLNQAARELDANHFDAALQQLDAINARQPDLAPTENLRGLVLMQQEEYREAETALRRALEIEPGFWDARFNLAEVSFLEKNWTKARHRFETLLADTSDQMSGATNQLIRYKLLLTFALDGQEKKAEKIVDEFKLSTETPAFYYSQAALAFQHGKQKEAKEWIATADKNFSSQLNELFAESFYEVGWLRRPSGAKPPALEITSTEERAARVTGEAQKDLEKAERAFQQRDLDGALEWLDRADADASESAVSYNLRGKILLEQKRFEEAETALKKALAVDPNFEEAQINLAQIPFKKKDYSAARERLEQLVRGRTADAKNQTAQLIQYRIFMTLLLQGQESAAQKMMDQFKFTDQTPALYYAEAAWAFQHQNPKQGKDWITSANKLFSPSLNRAFADSLGDVVSLGGLTTSAAASPMAAVGKPTPAARALTTTTPPLPPANRSPAPMVVESRPTASPTAGTALASSPHVTSSTPAPTPSSTASTASKKSGDVASKKERPHRAKSTSAKRTTARAKKPAARKTAASKPVARPSPTPTPPLPTPTPEPSRPGFLTRAMRTLLSPINRRQRSNSIVQPLPTTASPTPSPAKQSRE